MSKWRTVRLRQELCEAVKRSHDQSFSQFVSEAVQMRLDELARKRTQTIERTIECPVIRERLLYTRHHLWSMVTPSGTVRLGLSDYAQKLMDRISRVQVSQLGSQVQRDHPFGLIETWMFKFELYSPVVGKIVRLNEAIQKTPTIISEDPYEAGWVAEIQPDNLVRLEEELRELMKPAQYKTWVSKHLAWSRERVHRRR
jgi:glycine cleavage system H protein